MLFRNDGKMFVRRLKKQAFNPEYTRKSIKHGEGKRGDFFYGMV